MSGEPVPIPSTFKTNLGSSSLTSDASPLPRWERLSTWVSENKAVVYTIAGVAIVASGAGVIYYISDSTRRLRDVEGQERKRLSKKERRRAKQEKEREKEKDQNRPNVEAAPQIIKESSRTSTVESHPLDGIPNIDESSIESLSDEVSFGLWSSWSVILPALINL